MRQVLLVMMVVASFLCNMQQAGSRAVPENTGAAGALVQEGTITVSITTGGGLFGPVKNQFKVGEEIPVAISMTDTGDKPAKYCLSTPLFQNRPQLKRDGQLIPYSTNVPQQTEKEDLIQNCERSAARRFEELQPKQTRVVDWFTISQKGIRWYSPLSPGHYELVLRRRLECCQGPMVESNKVAFEVVP